MDRSHTDIEEQSLVDLEWPALLDALVVRCKSEGARAIATRLPLLDDATKVERLLDLVTETRQIHENDRPLPFEEIPQLTRHLQRLAKDGALSGTSLLGIARTLRSVSLVARFAVARRCTAPTLAGLADGIQSLDYVWQPILDAFEPNGELSDHASPELGQLRRRVSRLHKQTTERMKQLLDKPSVAKHLQDHFYTQREERYVLPVRSDAGPVVPGIVHGSSASGATIFVEPQQVIDLNNELKVAQVDVERETQRILTDLSAIVAADLSAIEVNLETICEIDLVNARALLAIEMDANRPKISTEGRITLKQLRHPLMLLSHERVVPHDVDLGPAQSLLISGPNAGGKTVCLKGIGLCALMLRGGMHLPAGPDSSMPLHKRILSDIGDDQSLTRNLSTFSGHISRLLAFLALSDPSTLVLLDEVVSGTDPTEGAALAQALLEAFAKHGVQLAATTHYDRIKSLPLQDHRFLNASVGFDLERLTPTFELHQGIPGSSFALPVAQQLGLTAEIAQRARDLAGEKRTQVADMIEELTQQRAKLSAAQRSAIDAQQRAETLERERVEELARLKERGRALLTQEHATALDELRRARAELRRLRLALRQSDTPERVRQVEGQIARAGRQVQKHAPERESPPGRNALDVDLVPGTRVWVRTLGGEAEVLEPQRRDKVAVRFGGLRTVVDTADLLIPAAPGNLSKNEQAPTSPDDTPSPAARRASVEPTIDNTVDLRGMRVDDALRETDNFIDQALLRGLDVVFIRHGHGSGALRGAVRANLQLSPAVERVHPADERQGGDAVTVVWLR